MIRNVYKTLHKRQKYPFVIVYILIILKIHNNKINIYIYTEIVYAIIRHKKWILIHIVKKGSTIYSFIC